MASRAEQNQIESRRETVAATRAIYLASVEAVEWFDTWKERHPDWVAKDLHTIQLKARALAKHFEEDAEWPIGDHTFKEQGGSLSQRLVRIEANEESYG